MTVRALSVGGLGTNCYIVTDNNRHAAVIDPGDEAARILDMLKKHGAVLKAVLLTHAHFDHMGALAALVQESGTPVYVHRDDLSAMTDGVKNLSAVFGMPLRTVATATPLTDGDTVTVGDMTFTVLHTPGHTPGSCCYRLDDVLFSGDTLFCESIGRTDFPGGDIHAMKASLARLLTLQGDITVYPGHDAPTTIAHEQQYNPYIR